MLMIRRNEVWWVNFSPAVGGEIKKTRPAVVISNNIANKQLNRVQVIPITSNIDKCYPCEAYVTVNGKLGKAMADQIVTISKSRLRNRIGDISIQEMDDIEHALKVQLGLK